MRILKRSLAIAALAVTPFAAVPASASTITFESQAVTNFFPPPSVSFVEGDFTLTVSGTIGSNGKISGSPSCTPACASNGTSAFYSQNVGLTISRTDGSGFALTSLDAAQYFTTFNASLDLFVTGTTQNATTVSAELTSAPGGADSFHTYSFTSIPGFDNLLSVTLSHPGFGLSSLYSVDNIVLASVTAVPEASTWALMIIGFAGIAFAGYRKAHWPDIRSAQPIQEGWFAVAA